MTTPTIAEFFSHAKTPQLNGSSEWASWYATELRRVVAQAAHHNPRSQQIHLGPSEIGVECDRQVVGKYAGIPETNHVVDPWPSFVGTAVHAALAEAFELDNTLTGIRWLAENRVTPHPEHAGTADLYDAKEQAVVDHKVLGESSLDKVKRPEGPPIKYKRQLWLYGLGFIRLGLPVKRVALAAYPRTKSTTAGLYVWESVWSAEVVNELTEVFQRNEQRKQQAQQIRDGHLRIEQIPKDLSDEECYFCPFYRPESRHDNGAGCPGA